MELWKLKKAKIYRVSQQVNLGKSCGSSPKAPAGCILPSSREVFLLSPSLF